VISPVMGGVIAALFLYVIKRTITYRQDWVAAARKVVPILIAVMAWAFATYLLLKGLKHLWKLDFLVAAAIGLAVAAAVYFVVKPMIHRAAAGLGDDRAGVNKLFVVPLIAAAAMLSFAHGANDVANAVGPLAAIHDAVISGGLAEKAAIPPWIMVVGAIGIALGLALYGPKLIRTVGAEITELDQSRAFCIALAAAITVIVASQLGIPISSTHTAIGAVFGVGILREVIRVNYAKVIGDIRLHHHGDRRLPAALPGGLLRAKRRDGQGAQKEEEASPEPDPQQARAQETRSQIPQGTGQTVLGPEDHRRLGDHGADVRPHGRVPFLHHPGHAAAVTLSGPFRVSSGWRRASA
jgi:PiT family inorganic phosphate transporter